MIIADDGKGFDANESGDGSGLNNMKRRAREMGGSLKIDSLSGKGTAIELDFQTT